MNNKLAALAKQNPALRAQIVPQLKKAATDAPTVFEGVLSKAEVFTEQEATAVLKKEGAKVASLSFSKPVRNFIGKDPSFMVVLSDVEGLLETGEKFTGTVHLECYRTGSAVGVSKKILITVV
jgi:hypothetical protein